MPHQHATPRRPAALYAPTPWHLRGRVFTPRRGDAPCPVSMPLDATPCATSTRDHARPHHTSPRVRHTMHIMHVHTTRGTLSHTPHALPSTKHIEGGVYRCIFLTTQSISHRSPLAGGGGNWHRGGRCLRRSCPPFNHRT